MSRGRFAASGILLGLVASQAGHVIAYQVRYGAAAERIQSAGAHAYFPTAVKTAFGLIAAFVLLAFVAIGAARLLAGKRLASSPGPSLLRILALLFCVQLTCFVVQETIEMAAGAPPVSAPALLLWGTVGQLPAAMVAALVLRWLAVRVAPAVAKMLTQATAAIRLAPQSVALILWPAAIRIPVEDRRPCRAFTRRGPPF
ncbi:MAG TPA: hypothetical protein VFR33_07425 [Candidatus Dormibacteraeota bacterium]|nr:hypothetical protein [Candidatus Dormibacteraeota bacterium]